MRFYISQNFIFKMAARADMCMNQRSVREFLVRERESSASIHRNNSNIPSGMRRHLRGKNREVPQLAAEKGACRDNGRSMRSYVAHMGPAHKLVRVYPIRKSP